jgi:hypothetical protein
MKLKSVLFFWGNDKKMAFKLAEYAIEEDLTQLADLGKALIGLL